MWKLPANVDAPAEQEFGSIVTHAIATALAVVALFALVICAVLKGTIWHVVSFSIYGVTLVALFLASTLYHAMRNPHAKRILRCADHAAIYVMIAGTYTPFMLTTFRLAYPGWAWSLFGVIWGLALAGVILKVFFTGKLQFLSTLVYLLMGWLVVLALKPIYLTLPRPGFWLLVAGGLSYTVGIFFYGSTRVPYNHVIWHLFVMAGSICHFCAIFLYLLLFP